MKINRLGLLINTGKFIETSHHLALGKRSLLVECDVLLVKDLYPIETLWSCGGGLGLNSNALLIHYKLITNNCCLLVFSLSEVITLYQPNVCQHELAWFTYFIFLDRVPNFCVKGLYSTILCDKVNQMNCLGDEEMRWRFSVEMVQADPKRRQ